MRLVLQDIDVYQGRRFGDISPLEEPFNDKRLCLVNYDF